MMDRIVKRCKSENKRVYVYAHKYPDGDAISSASAIVEYLKNEGIEAKYVVSDEVNKYSNIVGKIPVTSEVSKGELSLIVDTSTAGYVENKMFLNSKVEDIYVIDHHGRVGNGDCIEDELKIPSENVVRNSYSSSACEVLIDVFDKEKITPRIADMLMLGLLTDTNKLKFLKSNTLSNVLKLKELGASYEEFVKCCSEKSKLSTCVAMARVFLDIKRFSIGNLYGMILLLDNEQVDSLKLNYGIENPQKQIFRMLDIEDVGFYCMSAENTLGEYAFEFRSTPIYGNFDVLSLAVENGGGGHYNASGCSLNNDFNYDKDLIALKMISTAEKAFSAKGDGIRRIELTDLDRKLIDILDRTNRLTVNLTDEVIKSVDNLIKKGANYNYAFTKYKTFERFMLENEILSRVSNDELFSKRIRIDLTEVDVDLLMRKYNVRESDILGVIDIFSNIDVDFVSIKLVDKLEVQIDKDGNIEMFRLNDIKALVEELKILNLGCFFEVISHDELSCSVPLEGLLLPNGFYWMDENLLISNGGKQFLVSEVKNDNLEQVGNFSYKK